MHLDIIAIQEETAKIFKKMDDYVINEAIEI